MMGTQASSSGVNVHPICIKPRFRQTAPSSDVLNILVVSTTPFSRTILIDHAKLGKGVNEVPLFVMIRGKRAQIVYQEENGLHQELRESD
jgi:hypothetical protein